MNDSNKDLAIAILLEMIAAEARKMKEKPSQTEAIRAAIGLAKAFEEIWADTYKNTENAT